MEYTKIQNNDYNIQENQFDKKIKLIDKDNDKFESEEKPNDVEMPQNQVINGKFGYILIIMLIIIFLFLVFIYQNITSNITKIVNNNTLNQEKDSEQLYEENLTEENIPFLQDVYKIEVFSSREKAFKRAKKFLENNINGTLLRNVTSLSINNPIATAVIPVYNSKNYILKAIRSIQNQNIMNIEIILVNDYSKDDTLSFIKEIQKEDPRIKIISNKKNMGIIYSRCIGTLSARGKYIFPLDNDDMFLDEDVFQTITNIAEKGFFDIVEFKGMESKRGDKGILLNKRRDTNWGNHPLNLVLYQPALGNYPIWPGRSLYTVHYETVYLWAKCIRTEIYQKTINKLGKERYSRYILRYEDIIMTYAIFNTAKSYKFVGKYGIFNIYRNESASRNKYMVDTDVYHIYYIDVIIDFVQDTVENKKILVNLILHLFNRKTLAKALKRSKDIEKIFYSNIDKILKMPKISNKLKDEIRKKGKQLKYIN